MSYTKVIRFLVFGLGVAFAAVFAAAAPAAAFAQTTGAAFERGSIDAESSEPAPDSAAAAESESSGAGALRGFYARAGVVLDWTRETRFVDEDCSSTSPAALYGCGVDDIGAPRSSLGDFGTTTGVQFGLGYILTPALRLEAIVQYVPGFSFDGRANFLQPSRQQTVSADLSFLTGMAAAYLDLPELGLPRLGPFRQFVGAGGGVSRIDIDETQMQFPKTTTIVPAGQRVNFAWMLTAGVAASLAEKTILDLAWRYADYGVVGTDRGAGRVVWRDGSRDPLALDLGRTQASLRGHELSISLRRVF